LAVARSAYRARFPGRLSVAPAFVARRGLLAPASRSRRALRLALGFPVFGSPVFGSPVFGSPALGLPLLGFPVLGCPVLGFPVLGLLGFPALGFPALSFPALAQPVRDVADERHRQRDQQVGGILRDVVIDRCDVLAGEVADADPGADPQ